MKNLNYSIKQLCKNNREGSFSTQSNREKGLQLIANQLHELGYRNLGVRGLKPKHIRALTDLWRDQKLSTGTIKNRMSQIRWWAKKVGKGSVVDRNEILGIGRRTYINNESNKAKDLDQEKLSLIDDKYINASLRLQAEFGLRREECIKFSPKYAISGDMLKLKSSWCKGGRAREIPIRTETQRSLLSEISRLVGGGALIRPDRNYIQQLKSYERVTIKAGLCRNHGLRHRYAQTRYEELTGSKCPAAGGLTSRELTPEQKEIDLTARLEISRELGHEREQITAIYLGR